MKIRRFIKKRRQRAARGQRIIDNRIAELKKQGAQVITVVDVGYLYKRVRGIVGGGTIIDSVRVNTTGVQS